MMQALPQQLPETLPVFPLTGVLLLPRAELPLNIFEPRYLEMVDDALREYRMIGMVQCRDEENVGPFYQVGCAGRITSFEETDDGRYLITLLGVQRFTITEEIPAETKYRRVRAAWKNFPHDGERTACFGFKHEKLFCVLQEYFKQQGLEMCRDMFREAPDERVISALSMICPLDPREKQALLEAPDCKTRGELLLAMLEMEIHKKDSHFKPL